MSHCCFQICTQSSCIKLFNLYLSSWITQLVGQAWYGSQTTWKSKQRNEIQCTWTICLPLRHRLHKDFTFTNSKHVEFDWMTIHSWKQSTTKSQETDQSCQSFWQIKAVKVSDSFWCSSSSSSAAVGVKFFGHEQYALASSTEKPSPQSFHFYQQ